MKKVLILNNSIKPCGVQQWGERIINILKNSNKYLFIYKEVNSKEETINAILAELPLIVIYNYNSTTMPFVTNDIIDIFISIKHVALVHEGYSHLDNFVGFDNIVYLIDDIEIEPEFKNKVFSTATRYLLPYHGTYPVNSVSTIGSFGFGFPRKRFDYIVEIVNKEFDIANIRFSISNSFHSDPLGEQAEKVIDTCYEKIIKPGIQLSVNRDFLSDDELLTFLAGNDVNCFFYDSEKSDGIAGSTDLALSVKRPIAITKVPMLSHLYKLAPDICIENSSLKKIMKKGIEPLQPIYDKFSDQNFILSFENICDLCTVN